MVCTVMPSRTPVFDAAALQPGTHLNAIGSFTPEITLYESVGSCVLDVAISIAVYNRVLGAAR